MENDSGKRGSGAADAAAPAADGRLCAGRHESRAALRLATGAWRGPLRIGGVLVRVALIHVMWARAYPRAAWVPAVVLVLLCALFCVPRC